MKQSPHYRRIFEQLGIKSVADRNGNIRSSYVLRVGRNSLKLYFNDSTESHPADFAANEEFYAAFTWEPEWTAVASTRNERPGYVKVIPRATKEQHALERLLAYANAAYSRR